MNWCSNRIQTTSHLGHDRESFSALARLEGICSLQSIFLMFFGCQTCLTAGNVCELTMYLELVFWSLLIYRELRSNQQLQHLHSMRSADLLWLWCYVFTKCRAIRKLCSKSLEKANSTLCKAVQNKVRDHSYTL